MKDIINYIIEELQDDRCIPMYELVRRGVFAEYDYLSVTAALWELLASGKVDCTEGYIILAERQTSDVDWSGLFDG